MPGEERPATQGPNAMAGLPDAVTQFQPFRPSPSRAGGKVRGAVSRRLAHGIRGANP